MVQEVWMGQSSIKELVGLMGQLFSGNQNQNGQLALSSNHQMKKILKYEKKLSVLWVLNAEICSFKFSFFRHEIIKLLDKTAYLSVNLLILIFLQFPISNNWFTFSSDSHNYETSISSKDFLKVKTVSTKKYGREAMINDAISSWNIFKKLFHLTYYVTFHILNWNLY